jgi:hypothetical protein
MLDKDSGPPLKEPRDVALLWGLAPLIILLMFVAAGLGLALITTQR